MLFPVTHLLTTILIWNNIHVVILVFTVLGFASRPKCPNHSIWKLSSNGPYKEVHPLLSIQILRGDITSWAKVNIDLGHEKIILKCLGLAACFDLLYYHLTYLKFGNFFHFGTGPYGRKLKMLQHLYIFLNIYLFFFTFPEGFFVTALLTLLSDQI